MLIIRVFAVAIWSPCADKLATTLLYRQGGVYFLGYILAVNLVDEIFQRHDISVLRSLCCQSIKIVVDSDKTDAEERENTLQIVTGFLVVTTKTRQVFYRDAVYPSFAHFLHHLLKLWTLKVSAGSPVVTEHSDKLHIRLVLNERGDQSFLTVNRIRAGFAAILCGQPDIGGCFVSLASRSRAFFLHKRIHLSFCPCHYITSRSPALRRMSSCHANSSCQR